MINILKRLIKYFAFKWDYLQPFYVKICNPSGSEYAFYLKSMGRFYSIGDDCMIRPYTNITDPYLVKIGNTG